MRVLRMWKEGSGEFARCALGAGGRVDGLRWMKTVLPVM